jgi:hypothetical protein
LWFAKCTRERRAKVVFPARADRSPPFYFGVPSMIDSLEVQVLFTTRWR